jgi:hypothetical protein
MDAALLAEIGEARSGVSETKPSREKPPKPRGPWSKGVGGVCTCVCSGTLVLYVVVCSMRMPLLLRLLFVL